MIGVKQRVPRLCGVFFGKVVNAGEDFQQIGNQGIFPVADCFIFTDQTGVRAFDNQSSPAYLDRLTKLQHNAPYLTVQYTVEFSFKDLAHYNRRSTSKTIACKDSPHVERNAGSTRAAA
jgi:hypothetical protein